MYSLILHDSVGY